MKCSKCGESLPVSEFYYYAKSARRDKACKGCRRKMARANRARRIEYYRAYDRERGNRQSLEWVKEYRRSSPAKYKAHNAVNNAIRDGLIIRMDCEVCGAGNVHAHHDDYLKPLTVRWLCPAHHKAWHVKNGPATNSDASEEDVLAAAKLQRMHMREPA